MLRRAALSYDSLAKRISIPGFHHVERDTAFDDAYCRSGGIRLLYPKINPLPPGVKTGILLEAGFDQVAPNRPRLITSWAYADTLALYYREQPSLEQILSRIGRDLARL